MTSTALTTIQHSEYGTVYEVTVTHTSRLNTLNSQVIRDLNVIFDRIDNDCNARVVVLRGKGERAWIGGADIREMVSLDTTGARLFIQKIHNICERIRGMNLPVIARINGYCLGAGLEVAACCDLRLAAQSAIFGMPEVLLGIPSVIEAAMLPRVIGLGHTVDLVMTGRKINAKRAADWGLIEEPVNMETLDQLVNERICQLLKADAKTLALQKNSHGSGWSYH